MSPLKLSQLGELSLLKEIRGRFVTKSKDVVVGIGDDAAVLKPRDEYLLVTTDMMVEGVHFDLHFMTAYQLGFKLISVNVSDIYAMGGKPSSVLLDLAMDGNTTKKFVDSFFGGVKDALKLYGAALIGGDISSSQETMAVAATVIGHARKYVQRSGARAGDRIYVTGSLGDSACGLEILKKIGRSVPLHEGAGHDTRRGRRKGTAPRALRSVFSQLGLSWKIAEPLVDRHLLPVARSPKRAFQIATSMLDISDGLLIDLSRLCDESGIGARIFEEHIPVSLELKEAAPKLGLDPLRLALSGGEDYELLFTAPAGKKIEAKCIGDVIESGRILVDGRGGERRFHAEGYRHFSEKKEV